MVRPEPQLEQFPFKGGQDIDCLATLKCSYIKVYKRESGQAVALFFIPIFADCRKTANRQAPVAPPAPVKTIALLRVVCVLLYVYASDVNKSKQSKENERP